MASTCEPVALVHYAPNVGVILPLGPSKSLKGEHQGRFTAFEVGVKLTQLAVVGTGADRSGPAGTVGTGRGLLQYCTATAVICVYLHLRAAQHCIRRGVRRR